MTMLRRGQVRPHGRQIADSAAVSDTHDDPLLATVASGNPSATTIPKPSHAQLPHQVLPPASTRAPSWWAANGCAMATATSSAATQSERPRQAVE
jgi:hypothetical protein